MKKLALIAVICLLAACNSDKKSDETPSTKEYEINDEMEPSGRNLSAGEKEAKLAVLIRQSKQTMDSIDAAYKNISRERRAAKLSADEREQVSEALVELSNARDLIVLEVQESVITELKEKTNALQTVMDNMNTRSAQMMNIATTLSKVSGIIAKTTNTLADALTMGLVRPKISTTNTEM